MPCNTLDSLGVTTFNVPIVFYTLWERCRVTKLIPWECPHSTFRLCFTRFEKMSGNKLDSPGSAQIQRFYYVSHALTGCQVTNLIPWGCPHSMFLLCFTRFERLLGNKLESLGVAAFNVSTMFYTL